MKLGIRSSGFIFIEQTMFFCLFVYTFRSSVRGASSEQFAQKTVLLKNVVYSKKVNLCKIKTI